MHPSRLDAAHLAAQAWRARSASEPAPPFAPLDHPARTVPLSGIYEASIPWLGWIEDAARVWVAFVTRDGLTLLWTQRDATGGVIGRPSQFQRDATRDNGADVVHIDKPIDGKAMPLLAGPSPVPAALKASTVDLLSPIVANGIALTLATQHARWNVRGASFGPLHSLFGDVYDALASHVDRLAERIAALGGVVPGTLELAAAIVAGSKVIAPMESPPPPGNGLATAYGKTESMGDAATTNALADVQEAVEKLGWKLRAHLQ
jgi:starvation-inducible DNA-binding protein